MRAERIRELRALAEKHKATHRSAKMLLECLDEIEHLQKINGYALEAIYSRFPKRAQSAKKLRTMVSA